MRDEKSPVEGMIEKFVKALNKPLPAFTRFAGIKEGKDIWTIHWDRKNPRNYMSVAIEIDYATNSRRISLV